MSSDKKVEYILKTYKGEMNSAQHRFLIDAEEKANDGYFSISEKYENGSWHSLDFFLVIIGVILIYLAIDNHLTTYIIENGVQKLPFSPIVGSIFPEVVVSILFFLVSLYMIIVKPVGQLIVTYQHRKP